MLDRPDLAAIRARAAYVAGGEDGGEHLIRRIAAEDVPALLAMLDGGRWQWGSRCTVHPDDEPAWFGPDERAAREHADRFPHREVVQRWIGSVRASGGGPP